jgi:N-acetylneuraminate synthase
MSTLCEIDRALTALSETLECAMLCTSTYPAEFKDVRLQRLHFLKKYGAIGLSGHHKGIAIDVAAAAMGCTYIERHVTLDRTWKGSDHAASLEPTGLKHLVRDLGAFEEANRLGPDIVDAELPIRKKLRG